MLTIYIGWDPREDLAWKVCAHSIHRRCRGDAVEVLALRQADLRLQGSYWRDVDTRASTEFSLTRFLTPHLALNRVASQARKPRYAVFADCDFLFQTDIRKVLDEVDPAMAVSVVKHDYDPTETTKMDGRTQHAYPRKNWSSFMVFNLEHPDCLSLTPEVVNASEPAYLHRLQWTRDEAIGSLDRRWNYLEGWYPAQDISPWGIHYTRGGPWFEQTRDCDFAAEWLRELEDLKKTGHRKPTRSSIRNTSPLISVDPTPVPI